MRALAAMRGVHIRADNSIGRAILSRNSGEATGA